MDQLCWIRVPSSGPHLILLSPLNGSVLGRKALLETEPMESQFLYHGLHPRPDPLFPYCHTGSEEL